MSTTTVNHDHNNSLTTSLTGATYTGSLSTASGTIGSILNTTSGGGGASGATLTTTSSGSLMWNNTNYTATASPYTVSNSTTGWNTFTQPATQGMLKVSGDAVFDGEVTIRGVRLDERLTAIEERLGILRPNNDLEGKWEKLKALGEEYRKLEKEILEGEDIWAMLKK
jgi:hypothetical protein